MNEAKWKLLLIDDDPGVRNILALALEDAGYTVLTAPDGEAGIRLFEEESPHIVITDIQMPKVSGIEVLRRIKEKDSNTEVIVVTAFSEIDLAVEALHLDASDFITKPVSDDALTVALKRAKDRYTTRKDLRDYTALIEERWITTAEELAKTFHFENMLIESSIDGIVACDTEGKVVIFNHSMECLLGLPKDQVIRWRSLDEFFAPGEAERFRVKLKSEECGGPNRLFLFEVALLDRTGGRIPCQVSAVVLFHEGKEAGLVCFFRDLREIRRLAQQVEDQARLLHQDKMISLGKLAASVVHEINNPVAGVLNYTRLMVKILGRGPMTPDTSNKFKGYLSLMESELSRCSKIIANLLAFSRKSKLEEFGSVNLNELLGRCLMLSEHRLSLQNIRAQVSVEEHLPTITGDFSQLQQCVINLIFNAVDAMPSGGVLTIKGVYDRAAEAVHIEVADTGCGIKEEDRPFIFDPFFTTKTEGKGLGLGLSTVYGIIDRHRGTIEVKSRPEAGTVFTIRLPGRVKSSPAP